MTTRADTVFANALPDELTSAERVRRLLAGEPVDRVPVNAFASAYAGIVSGISFEDYYLKPEVALRAQQWAGALHGWDGAPARNAPGFPDDGKWVVRWEGLKPAP